MARKSEKGKSDKKLPKLGLQSGHNGKPGRYYVRLNGRRTYLGYEDGTGETPSAVTQRYLEAVLQWQKNGCKPLPTHVKTGISVEELAIKYLGYVETRGYSKDYVGHIRIAMQFLIDQCGNLSTADFTRHTLKALQTKLEERRDLRRGKRRDLRWRGEEGIPFCRDSVNRYISLVRKAFEVGDENGWGIDEKLPDKLKKVKPLRSENTTAPDYQAVEPVEVEIVKATLPFMSYNNHAYFRNPNQVKNQKRNRRCWNNRT